MTYHSTRLTDAEAHERLREVLELGGRGDKVLIHNAEHGRFFDPRYAHLIRPDGEQRRVYSSSIRALERRGLLRVVEDGPDGERWMEAADGDAGDPG